MVKWKDMCSSSPVRTPNYNSLLNKDTPDPRAKEKHKQDGRRGEITFRNKPHIFQRHSEDSTKTLGAPGPRNPVETEPDLPLSV